LMKRARRIGYELFLEEEPRGKERLLTIHHRPPRDPERPAYLLEWGKSLISFQPSLQTARQVSEVTVRGWDPKTKSEITHTAKKSDLGDEKVILLSDLGVKDDGINHKHEVVVKKPIRSPEEAKTLA